MHLALVKFTFLVADANFAVEDVLIGLLALQNMGVDTKELLQERRNIVNGVECPKTNVAHASKHEGKVSCPMAPRLSRLSNEDIDGDSQMVESGPRVSYYNLGKNAGPLHDASLLNQVDSNQHSDFDIAITKMV